ncbi:protein jagunal homolog 1-A-like [Bolinopsis microptera]|uniref:protein jagunal homolog 1-A-like n=1 Tax=Bolinopsis microptera TaxID=2820187 RepID=UPI003078EAB4
MSSSSGPRAEGTDGSDWKHREKRRLMKEANNVAVQYVTSVKYKNAMKRTLIYHGMLGTSMFATAVIAGINCLYIWQVLWLATFPACLIGFRGIMKNKSKYLNLYRIVLCLCSIPACIWGLLATAGIVSHREFYPLVSLPKPTRFLMPDSSYVFYFLGATTLCSHLFSLAAIRKLMYAWDITSRKSKAQ